MIDVLKRYGYGPIQDCFERNRFGDITAVNNKTGVGIIDVTVRVRAIHFNEMAVNDEKHIHTRY